MDRLVEFEKYLYKWGHTKQTVASYLFQVKPFVTTFPELNGFTFKEVHHAMTGFLKNQKNQNYKNTILSAIKKYYDHLLDAGLRNDHPCRTMRFKAIRKKGVIHEDLFASAELELLMERKERYPLLKARNQVIASLLIYQGLSAQELVEMKVQHIKLDEGKVYVKETKATTRRHLELHPKQYWVFESYLKESRKELLKTETDSLLIGIRGVPVTSGEVFYFVETFKPLFTDRNLNPEAIRRSVISNWLNEKRFPLEQVQLMAGHRWISTTARYRQTAIDERRNLINRLHPLG